VIATTACKVKAKSLTQHTPYPINLVGDVLYSTTNKAKTANVITKNCVLEDIFRVIPPKSLL